MQRSNKGFSLLCWLYWLDIKRYNRGTDYGRLEQRNKRHSRLAGVVQGGACDRAERNGQRVGTGTGDFGVRGTGSSAAQRPLAGQRDWEKGLADNRLHHGGNRP